jgi:predicted DNA-binding transcriptional regulator AlpA
MSIEDHPTDETPNAPATTERTDLELWDRATVLKFFGGSKPIHVSTLYRGIHSGRYPSPMNVSDNVVRWIGHECRAARQRMFSERGKPKLTTPRRGRPRRQIAHDMSGDEPVRPASARRKPLATTLA